ncbi:MAG TPA: M4 family metallopeptidase [Thermoanaerobaculia bacterium]|nr:M4 family metallopeptidase [Thermoanaerobaculia bacterium]
MFCASSRRRTLWLAACAACMFLPVPGAHAQVARPAVAVAVDEMAFATGGEITATLSAEGTVSFLRTAPGTSIPVDHLGGAEERAREFLDSYAAAFALVPGVELDLLRESGVDEVGMEHVRFRQAYRGIPVAGGELTVHLRGRGVVAANANTAADLESVVLDPRIGPAEALALVREELERTLGVTDAELSEPRLEILDPSLLGGGGFAAELTWFVEARKVDLWELLWISARAPRVALRFSQLAHGRNRLVYDANDPGDGSLAQLPGLLVRSEGGPPVAGAAAADANAAYDFLGDTYDYYLGEHGRDSYDDAGATLVGTVRFCPNSTNCPYQNAFWNGEQMVFGAGFSAADDVVAHELAHAVTQNTANLFYYMQSGALNESYSDIFGETIDQLNGAGSDTPAQRWYMGEDVPGLGAARHMANPPLFGHPGKTSDPEFFCGDDYRADGGGVHRNSGVPNRAYSLMVDGGTYNGQAVTGIGLAKAGKIQYRTLSRYLLSASDFADNDNALRQSCQDLIGTAGITATDCTQVGKALDAVEMAATWPCAPLQAEVPAFCPAGQGPDLWYYEDFEGEVVGVPTCPSNGVPAGWCVNEPSSLLGTFATSGERSLWGYNQASAGTIWFWRNFLEMPPEGARLQFNHAHGFDNNGGTFFDAGHVIVSTNGGATFDNAQFLIKDGEPYDGPISTCCGNPFGGLDGIVADSWGYTASQLDLGLLTGSAFSYGFVVATDNAIDEYGWFVDDVRIYTCATCLAHRTLDAGYTGMADHYQASDSITAGDGFTVQPGESVTLEAGNRVALGNGFRVAGELTVLAGSEACP